MPDEQPAGRPEEQSGTDHTSWFAPFADRTDPDDGPRSGDRSDGPDTDETQPLPSTPGVSEGEGTSILPAVSAADATRVTPATGEAARRGADRLSADRWGAGRPPGGWADVGRAEAAARAAAGQAGGRDGQGEDPVWSARAQVEPGRAGQGGHFTPTEWTPVVAEPRRPWWFPILMGIVVMLLLALLGFGLWLIMKGLDDAPGSPVPTPAIQQPTAEPTTEPTSSPPTTTSPSLSPSPSVALVAVPPVAGFSASEARRALDEAGLSYQLILRESATVPAGTVIGSEPFEGREVPAGTEVTLMVAVAPTASAPSAGPTSTDDAPQPDHGQDAGDDEDPDEG